MVIAAAVVVILVGALAVVLLTAGGSITASGTVRDSMTDNPITAASVTAGDQTAATDAQGAFQLTGLEKGATLTFTADNYAAATAVADTSMTVKLDPLAAKATATSLMTGESINATFETPDGTKVTSTAGAAATIYRVGPGDTVTANAPGYLSGKATVTPERTVTAALQPTWDTASSQIIAWMKAKDFTKITDWVLSKRTGDKYESVGGMDATSDPPFTFATVRLVSGQGVIVMLSATATPEAVDTHTVDAPGFTPVTIAGQQAWHGTASDGTAVTVWLRGPIMLAATGTNTATNDAALNKILSAMPAS